MNFRTELDPDGKTLVFVDGRDPDDNPIVISDDELQSRLGGFIVRLTQSGDPNIEFIEWMGFWVSLTGE